jgi:hypothetical protein
VHLDISFLHFGARRFFGLSRPSGGVMPPKDLIFLLAGSLSLKCVTGEDYSLMSDESCGMFYEISS